MQKASGDGYRRTVGDEDEPGFCLILLMVARDRAPGSGDGRGQGYFPVFSNGREEEYGQAG